MPNEYDDEFSDEWLEKVLRCPRDGKSLERDGNRLVCTGRHSYPIIEGVPVLLLDGQQQTIELAERSLMSAAAKHAVDDYYIDTLGISEEEKECVRKSIGRDRKVDPVVSYLVGATNGIMYKHLIGKLDEYPIPDIDIGPGEGRRLLDVGCSWGRWSIAANRKGYKTVGIDPSLGAILAAKRLTKSLGITASFVVGDARYLPFNNDALDYVFSYSVLQHFSRENMEKAVTEISRVLKENGHGCIQMANKYGLRSVYHQIKRKYREPRDFEVRYWSIGDLEKVFRDRVGTVHFDPDCFLGLGLQPSDSKHMSAGRKIILGISEGLKKISRIFRPLGYLSDSIYIRF